MIYAGKIKNGVVVLDSGVQLPEGISVSVEPTEELDEDSVRDFLDRTLEIARTMEGLPPDLARNHDHYLHGRPKQ